MLAFVSILEKHGTDSVSESDNLKESPLQSAVISLLSGPGLNFHSAPHMLFGDSSSLSVSFSCVCIFPLKLFYALLVTHLGFPGGSDGKNLPAMQETQVRHPGWEDPLEKGMATHSTLFLPEESHGQRSLITVHGVTKSWTRLSD